MYLFGQHIGLTTDPEAAANGSLIGIVKRLRTLLGGGLPAALAAGGGMKIEGVAGGEPVGVGVSTVTLPTAIYNGVKTVTTATTRVALATTQALKSGVQIKAYLGNTGIIYVGNATVAAANGYRLNAGESVFLEIADLATVYLDASVSGEGVSYVAS